MDDVLTAAGKVLGSVAPMLASAFGGPLAGAATSAIIGALGLAPDSSQTAVAQVVAGATADQLLALKQADQAFTETMGKLNLDAAALAGKDVQGARDMRVDAMKAGNSTADRMAWAIAISFWAVMLLVLFGCYAALSGSLKVTADNTPIWLAVTSLIGGIVGYYASGYQQVIGFLYGSSQGSQSKSDNLSDAMKTAVGGLTQAAQGGSVTTRPLGQ